VDSATVPLKILLVEDSPADADLVLRELRDELAQPFEHSRVDSEAGLRKALREFVPDVVLSDFSMPGFSGQAALAIVSEHAPDTPLVFVSGAVGEELAIEALKRGAADYVLKDNLRRLPSAVWRALQLKRDRIERRHIERALMESEDRFRNIVENSQDWIWEIDLQGRQTYCNPSVHRILGYSPDEMEGEDSLQYLHPEDVGEVRRRLPDLINRREGWRRWRLRWLHREGGVRILESTAIPIVDAGGELAGYRGIDHDVTEFEVQQARIRHLGRLHAVLSALGNAVLRAGTRQGVLDEACRVAVEEGGFLAACIGQMAEDGTLRMISRHGDRKVTEALAAIGRRAPEIADPGQCSPGIRVLRTGRNVIVPDLSEAMSIPAWVRSRMDECGVAAQALLPVGNPAWAVVGLYADEPQSFDRDEVALFERLAAEIDFGVDFIAKGERLQYLAFFNPVSGLPNRAAFRMQLEKRMAVGPVTVALVDIRRFSALNQSRGRLFGDRLLEQVGQRLCALAGPDSIAHMEADKFALAYPTLGTSQLECERLETLIQEFEREPIVVDQENLRIELRGGIAFAPAHGEDAEAVENNALAAMTEGSKRGLHVHVFDESLRGRAAARLALENDLRHALQRQEFELFYQPKFNAASQRLVGAEALLRWRHPQRGLVSPAEFIPLLEESGLIMPVGHWVMEEALRTALAWRERQPDLRIAVNVSARELRRIRFLADCHELLHAHAANQLIDIEITESLLMDDIEANTRLLDSLRGLGCRIAIDDFGTGYSSLNYLTRLPVDTIKIDQSFITLLTQSPETMAMVTNIIGLAHSLSLSVVAEGVEEEGQANLLRLLRCDELQGYLLGRPMAGADFVNQFLAPPPAAG